MFYEEQIVNGVLCSRTSPGGEWKPFTPEELTKRLIAARKLRDSIDGCEELLQNNAARG